MHSELSMRRLSKEEGRRAQIIAATIYTLAELGYVNTSFVQIAKRASISPSLISYHFKDKEDLIAQTLSDITSKWIMYVQSNVMRADTATEKLHAYIRSNLTYMSERPEHMAARIEIIFNMRSKDGRLHLQTESYDYVISGLTTILEEGRRDGTFGDFDTFNMAIVIRASIDQFLGLMNSKRFDVESYIAQVITIFDLATHNSKTTHL